MSYYIKNNNSIHSFLDSFLDDIYYKDIRSQRNSNIIQQDDSIDIEIEAVGLAQTYNINDISPRWQQERQSTRYFH